LRSAKEWPVYLKIEGGAEAIFDGPPTCPVLDVPNWYFLLIDRKNRLPAVPWQWAHEINSDFLLVEIIEATLDKVRMEQINDTTSSHKR